MKPIALEKIIQWTTRGSAVVLAVTALSASATDRLYVYPNDNQSESLMANDRYQCHRWAVAETGFNPLDNQPVSPRGPIRVPVANNPSEGATGKGILTGAVVGAVIGATDHHAGKGAAIGAAIGAIAGGTKEKRGQDRVQSEAEAEARQLAEDRAAERERIEHGRNSYRRAISACLEGKNYTVK